MADVADVACGAAGGATTGQKGARGRREAGGGETSSPREVGVVYRGRDMQELGLDERVGVR
jgi:hypothetical protein